MGQETITLIIEIQDLPLHQDLFQIKNKAKLMYRQ